jgi:hypothetical protein
MRNIIGGQIGYDNLIDKKLNFLKKKEIYANGRSALYFILKKIKRKITKVYVPNYLCESILQPIKELNLEYEFYEIKNNFQFILPKRNNSAIIFLNYFGINHKKSKILKNDFKKKIFYIQDCTHNVFDKQKNLNNFNKKDIFRFASIKKYIPFPLGAITNIKKDKLKKNTTQEIKIYKEIFDSLKKRSEYFSQPNEKINISLEKIMLKKQNKFKLYENTKIIKSEIPTEIKEKILHYDLKKILYKRNKNFSLLKKKLNKKIMIVSQNISYPLNLTILLTKTKKIKVKNFMNKCRIFPSTLWPVPEEVRKKKFIYPQKLNSEILSLPIDHRYKKKDIEFMSTIIHKALKL